MQTIDDLRKGYRRFRQTRFHKDQELYSSLAEGQDPNVMVIACADSRVVPSSIFSVRPGDIFSVRNVANLVPPYTPDDGYHGTSAAIEFAVCFLNVTDILVMGHTNCGGARACLEGRQKSIGEFISTWVNIAHPARDHVLAHTHLSPEAQGRLIEQEIVKLSVQNLLTFPFVKQRVEEGKLALHGAIFSISDGILHWHEEKTDSFIPLLDE